MPSKPNESQWAQTHRMIGQRLRWARELIYPSQAAFARALDVDKSTIAKIEAGQRGLTVITLIYAANKLRTGADFLLFGDLRGVEPSLLAKLLRLHPELADMPQLPAKPRRPVFDPVWEETSASGDSVSLPTLPCKGTSPRPPPRSRRADRSD